MSGGSFSIASRVAAAMTAVRIAVTNAARIATTTRATAAATTEYHPDEAGAAGDTAGEGR